MTNDRDLYDETRGGDWPVEPKHDLHNIYYGTYTQL